MFRSYLPSKSGNERLCYPSIYRLVFNLDPPDYSIVVYNQIKWGMFSYRIQYYKSLLEQIELSLQNTQVTFLFGMVQDDMLYTNQ